MTIEEAIKRCEEVAGEKSAEATHYHFSDEKSLKCCMCADEYRQLAKWLTELKAVREAWSQLVETVIELRDNEGTGTQQEVCRFLTKYISGLEKEIMQKTGKW